MADVLAFESDWPDSSRAFELLSSAAAELDARGLLHAAHWAQQLALCALTNVEQQQQPPHLDPESPLEQAASFPHQHQHHHHHEVDVELQDVLGSVPGLDAGSTPVASTPARLRKSTSQFQPQSQVQSQSQPQSQSQLPALGSVGSGGGGDSYAKARRPRVHFDSSQPYSPSQSTAATTSTSTSTSTSTGNSNRTRTMPPPLSSSIGRPLPTLPSSAAPSTAPPLPASASRPSPRSVANTRHEAIFRAARLSFSLAQLERCVDLLQGETGTPQDARSQFLRLYTQFLISERSMADVERLLPRVPGQLPAASPDLMRLLSELVNPDDSYLLFLKGVVLMRLHQLPEATDCLVRSVRTYPYNWSVWLELSKCLGPDTFELADISDWLPQSFMVSFFVEHHVRSRARDDEGNAVRQEMLLRRFPQSTHLLTAQALTAHTLMRHATAAELFSHVLHLDPYATEGLAEYSNSLHLLRDRTTLAQLAQRYSTLGATNANVCVLLGNYHNSRGDRVRAISAFQRALRLDLGCLMAWVLLGHEYVELKNPPAAAEMYRRALELDPHDFRSWHGLGQVYELSEAWTYAVYYYAQAAQVRPYDARIWLALGACYDKLNRPQDAVRAFKRQLACRPDLAETVAAIERIIRVLERDPTDPSASASSKKKNDALDWHLRLVTLVDAHLFPRPAASRIRTRVPDTTTNPTGATGPSYPTNNNAIEVEGEDEGDEPADAAALDEDPQAEGLASWGLARFARSYLVAARHELGLDSGPDSSFEDSDRVACSPGKYRCAHRLQHSSGNVALAHEYLQKVVLAGTQVSDEAEELLKRVRMWHE